jgi:hypothetical protein
MDYVNSLKKDIGRVITILWEYLRRNEEYRNDYYNEYSNINKFVGQELLRSNYNLVSLNRLNIYEKFSKKYNIGLNDPKLALTGIKPINLEDIINCVDPSGYIIPEEYYYTKPFSVYFLNFTYNSQVINMPICEEDRSYIKEYYDSERNIQIFYQFKIDHPELFSQNESNMTLHDIFKNIRCVTQFPALMNSDKNPNQTALEYAHVSTFYNYALTLKTIGSPKQEIINSLAEAERAFYELVKFNIGESDFINSSENIDKRAAGLWIFDYMNENRLNDNRGDKATAIRAFTNTFERFFNPDKEIPGKYYKWLRITKQCISDGKIYPIP